MPSLLQLIVEELLREAEVGNYPIINVDKKTAEDLRHIENIIEVDREGLPAANTHLFRMKYQDGK